MCVCWFFVLVFAVGGGGGVGGGGVVVIFCCCFQTAIVDFTLFVLFVFLLFFFFLNLVLIQWAQLCTLHTDDDHVGLNVLRCQVNILGTDCLLLYLNWVQLGLPWSARGTRSCPKTAAGSHSASCDA